MKIGDKVRFLSAVGGGIVKSFQGKEIVLVEEEDGFETPVLVRECVVIENNVQQTRNTAPAITPAPEERKEEPEYEELPGKELLNLYLAYLPENIKSLNNGKYEAYIVNDSNYFLYVNYMTSENASWRSVFHGLVEPNTRLFVHEFSKENLNELERVCLQCLALKKDKPYGIKNPYSVELRIDTVKFYKIHCFRENDFFDEDAMVYPVVLNDVPEREMLISTTDLKEAMLEKKRDERRAPQIAVKHDTGNRIEEVDLHADSLLDTTAGMSNADILEYQLEKFREVLQRLKDKKGQKVVFIHGKGEGVLRSAILNELKTKYKNFPYQDASFKEYGFGATLVTIK